MSDIKDSFSKLIQEEIISDYTCENCKTKVNVGKRTFLKDLPNVLIIHLQKIIFDLDYLQNIKLSNQYSFPNEIDLKPYVFLENPEHIPKSEATPVQAEDDEYVYKLVGVVLHSGNAEYGHYTSLINVNRNDPNRTHLDKDVWYDFDDRRVSKYNLNNFQQDCFGESKESRRERISSFMALDSGSSKSAYILVYDKVKKSKIHFHFTEENLREKEKLVKNLIEKDQYKFTDFEFETDFYNVGKFIKPDYSTEINKDNSSLVLEEQLLNKNFTNNFSSIITHSKLPPLNTIEKYLIEDQEQEFSEDVKELSKTILEILPLYLFKIYTEAIHNSSMSNMVKILYKAMII